MANSLDPDQDDVPSVLVWIKTVDILIVFLKEIVEKKLFRKKSAGGKSMTDYPACKELSVVLTRLIQASLCIIQGLFKDFYRTFLLFSRTEKL